MKRLIKKMGIAAFMDVLAVIIAAVLMLGGVYFVNELWCYELECALIWLTGMVMICYGIHSIGEDIEDEKFLESWKENKNNNN